MMFWRHKYFMLFSIILPIIIEVTVATFLDQPCAAKQVFNRSVICVCNASYCDTIHREKLAPGEYVTYVSTEGGLRFQKTKLSLVSQDQICPNSNNLTTLTLDVARKYQTINGFGAAITDAAGKNWDELSDPKLKRQFIESHCGNSGLEYNMLRVPIGGCDFSTHEYAYNELPEDDIELKNFTLSPEDYNYKIPMIKACMEAATADIDIVATTWTPPRWMKDNYDDHGISFVKKKYFQTYANYHRKFIDEYKKEGIKIWGVTTTNEPSNGALNTTNINKLGWTTHDMADYIADYFGPTMKKYYPEVKLIGGDDQRNTIPIWFTTVRMSRTEVPTILDGFAVHFYYDDITPPSMLVDPFKNYPDLFVIATEACGGAFDAVKVDLGSWDRAELYARDIIEDLNYNVIGWLDWNMCLDENGGPNWLNSSVDSPVIVKPDEGVFYKQPMFYAMGHFSKFVPRGSIRIHSDDSSMSLKHVALLTPQDTIVVVILNDEKETKEVNVNLGNSEVKILLEPKSITTVELSY